MIKPFEKFYKLRKIEDPKPKVGQPERKVFSCIAVCQLCPGGKTNIKYKSDSKGNLRVHLKGKAHPGHRTADVLAEFDEINRATSKKGHNKHKEDNTRQLTFKQAQEMSRQFTQEKVIVI